MTLIVGKAVRGKQVYLLGDTRITDPRNRANPTHGMLKILILTPTLAVGFSGDPDLAKLAVQEYRSKFGSTSTLEGATNHFKAHTKDNENEYLLAFASLSQLVRVANGGAQTRFKEAWIGDRAAFDHFSKPPTPGLTLANSSYHRMITLGPNFPKSDAILGDLGRFAEVVENPSFPGVGDFFMLVAVYEGRFSLGMIASLFFDNSGILTPEGSTVMTAKGENREYQFSTWVPKEPDVTALAYVFPQVKKCFVFHSDEQNFADQCTVLRNLSSNEVAEEIRNKLGLDMHVILVRHT